MAELHKRREKERKATQDWLNNSKCSLERAISNIDKYQERKLLTSQTILLVFIGAAIINLLTSALYNLIITSQEFYLDMLVVVFSITALVTVYFFLRRELSKYRPLMPTVGFLVKPEDAEPFLLAPVFRGIIQYLEEGKLRNFKDFATNFFESLYVWFPFMFTDKVVKKPLNESEIFEDPSSEEFPTVTKEFDISPISLTGVKATIEVELSPNFTRYITREGDKSASYSFYLIFRIKVLNPKHCDANKFLEDYYNFFASDLIRFSSFSIHSAFLKQADFADPTFKGLKAVKEKEETKAATKNSDAKP